MSKPEEDLKAILDILAEWRKENRAGCVNIFICNDGGGMAYSRGNSGSEYEVSGEYGLCKAETPGAAAPRESR